MGWRKYAKPVLNPRDTYLESKSTLHRKYLLNKAYVMQPSEEHSCGRNCCPRFCTYMEKHELRFSKLNIWNIFLINLSIAKLVTQAWCYKEQSPAPKFSKIHISLLHRCLLFCLRLQSGEWGKNQDFVPTTRGYKPGFEPGKGRGQQAGSTR